MNQRFTVSIAALSLLAAAGCGGGSPPPVTTPVTNPVPAITSLAPSSASAGSGAITVAVTGTGFISASTLEWNGVAVPTTYTSSTALSAALPAADIAAGQIAQVSVKNPAPGGGNSPITTFDVTSPTPQVSAISPDIIPQGSAATITVTGTGFEANSTGTWNGSARTTTFVSSTSLQVALTASDAQSSGSGQLAIINPGPDGSTTPAIGVPIVPPTPIISSVSPSSVLIDASANTPLAITIQGSQFAANATLTINGQSLAITSQSATSIRSAIPAAELSQAEQLPLVVTNPSIVSALSAPYVFYVEAVPTVSSITPASAPIGSSDQTIQVSGSGFLTASTVNWNGLPLATQLVNNAFPYGPTLNAILPAAYLSMPTIGAITVSSPENTAAVSQPQAFPTYLSLPTNTMIYNPKDGMLYASVPGYAGPGVGNSVVAINPANGVIAKTIPTGSEPDKLSISDDGTQLYVTLDGAAAVQKLDLTGATPGLQFSLGEYGVGQSYSFPITAADVAAVPGQPGSVVVLASNAYVTVYDAGVARQNQWALDGYFNQNYGEIAFGPSAATLYAATYSDGGGGLAELTLDSTGFTGSTLLSSPFFAYSSIQYDAGNLYFNDGTVLNATSGAQTGQFYTSGTNLAAGPAVSDSTLGKAWVIPQNPLTPGAANEILAFDETIFNQVGSIVVAGNSASGPSLNAIDLVRWGQNGLAFNTSNQIYILQSPVVKDLSQSPADLSVAIQAPSTAATGGSLTYSITVTNIGPNAAQGVSLSATLADSVAYQSTTASAGSCTGTNQVICTLGTLAGGATVNVQVVGTSLDPGSIESTAVVSSTSYDPAQSNNIVTATTTVSGTANAATPSMASVSPALILAGSSATTLTVNGTGFTSASTVSWNGNPLPTTYLSSTQLAASLAASYIGNLGWGQVAVSTPAPGGGQSSAKVVSVYQSVNVPAAGVLYEPFTRQL